MDMFSEAALKYRINMILKKNDRLGFCFNLVFRQGAGLEVSTGSSIREVVTSQIGISEDYLDKRIQTIFLNGRAVDDVDSMKIRDGDVLALSAAMPGLVGATLRKGGKYASFRQPISLKDDASVSVIKDGRITLKLFNQIAGEQGLLLLHKGIWMKGRDFIDAVKKIKDMSMLNEIESFEINGMAFSFPEEILSTISENADVFVSVVRRKEGDGKNFSKRNH